MHDLELGGGSIWTAHDATPVARSLRIERGRVAALDAPPGPGAIDLQGRTVLPGLIDAHAHLLLGGEALTQLDLGAVDSREAFETAIAARHAELPPDAWLVARGWSEERWGGEPPTASWLRAAGDRPVVCHRVDLHAALVNEAVLARCDPTREPAGGRIVRDGSGRPTGLLVEAAAWRLVNPLIPPPDEETRREARRLAERACLAVGLTAVGSMEYAAGVEAILRPARDDALLRLRVTLLDRGWPLDPSYGAGFAGDERLAVIGYKAFLDGTMGSRTARLRADYADDAGNRGTWLECAADGTLHAWARCVADAGLSPSMHAIGDDAVRLALDVVGVLDPAARPRIEHAQQIDRADLARFDGVIASMQPLHIADDGRYLARRLGTERLGGSFPFRSLLAAGARLAFGSDWPVVSPDPMAGIRAAVTGRTAEGVRFLDRERIEVETALRAYTVGAAWCLGLEGGGRLGPGDLGDLVVVDRDPFTADWDEAPPTVLATVVGGRIAYDPHGVLRPEEAGR
jgi:predicted amidohydrolase YtcJ